MVDAIDSGPPHVMLHEHIDLQKPYQQQKTVL